MHCWRFVSSSSLAVRQGRRCGYVLPWIRGVTACRRKHETVYQVLEVSAAGGAPALRDREISGLELRGLTGVYARDLRVLNDRSGDAFRALIQPRGHKAILLRMCLFRAVMTADRFMMFQASPQARMFARLHLLPIVNETLLKQSPQLLEDETLVETSEDDPATTDEIAPSFEMRCLAAVLSVTQRQLRRRALCFGPVVKRLLDQVVSEEPEQALNQLLSVQRALSELQHGCDSIVHCIDEVLQNDEEMLSLLLTAKQDLPEGVLPPSNHHVHVESLLESYHYTFKEVSDSLFLNIQAIEATQRAVQISLESKRTRLLNLNVHISIATVSLASIATVGSIFGMNLASGLENAPGLFLAATSGSLVLAVVVYATYVNFLRSRELLLQKRLQRMATLCAIADEMPLLTDIILSQIEVVSKTGSSGSLPLAKFSHATPKQEAKDYLTLDDFRQLCRLEAVSPEGVPDEEIVKLFQTLDSDNNGRLEHHDVAEFLCIQSSPLSGLGHGV